MDVDEGVPGIAWWHIAFSNGSVDRPALVLTTRRRAEVVPCEADTTVIIRATIRSIVAWDRVVGGNKAARGAW